MEDPKVTRNGLLEYAEWCRAFAENEVCSGPPMSRAGLIAQMYILDYTSECGLEPDELLSCARVAESLANYGDF